MPEKYHHHLDDAPVFCHAGDPGDLREKDFDSVASIKPGEDAAETGEAVSQFAQFTSSRHAMFHVPKYCSLYS